MDSSAPEQPTLPFPKIPSTAALRGRRIMKWTAVLVVLLMAAAVLYVLFFTERGAELRSDPRLLRQDVHFMVAQHPFVAPLLFLITYIVFSLLLLPIVWLLILAGLGYGLVTGSFICLVSSAISATLTVMFSRWVAADWFHDRVEARLEKLRRIESALGHNGFLVVMAVRLVHLLPFGLCNYAMGLTPISFRDVFIGTFLGNIPAVAFYVGVGAGLRPLRNWEFMTALATINVLLLVPLALRYWKPEWFEKFGIE